MKTILSSVMALLAVGAASAGAIESVKVSASADFRLVVVDTTKSGADDKALYETFGLSFSDGLGRQFGAPMKVKVITGTDVQVAADKVLTGSYDAALVISDDLPLSMTSSEFSVTRAFSKVGIPVKVFHFVVRASDPSLKQKASAAFTEALSTQRFQDALNRAVAYKVTTTVAHR